MIFQQLFNRQSLHRVRHQWWLIPVLLVVSFVLWLLFALNGLRSFLPYAFNWGGWPWQSKTYLVVFQNNTETRPLGGFISAYGLLTTRGGIPTSWQIHDVYTLTKRSEIMPYPLVKLAPELMGTDYPGYNFQDINFVPDFPTLAKDAPQFLETDLDGVISVNYTVLQDLVRVSGPLLVNGQEVREDNLFYLLENEVNNVDAHNVQALHDRKGILSVLGKELMQSIVLDVPNYPTVFSTIEKHLNQRNILLYFRDEGLQNLVKSHGWSGEFPITTGDIMALVEANLGGYKSDRYLQKDFTYTLTYDPLTRPHLKAKATLRLAHPGSYNEPLSYTYRGFFRLYAPLGSTLLHSETTVYNFPELGYQVFGRTVTLDPGSETTLEWEYALPDSLLNTPYTLTYYRQPGQTNLHSRFTFRAPLDYSLTSPELTVTENVATWDTSTENTKTLTLHWQPDHYPPRVTFQEMRSLGTIEVHFNEPLQTEACEDYTRYKLTDLDEKNNQHDTPLITSVTCRDRLMTIQVVNLSTQPQERYRLSLPALVDLSNNYALPREITVVQRF